MATAKDIRVAPIRSDDARRFVERWHYSGGTVNNSQVHLGAFMDARLVGVMLLGPPMDRGHVLPLVRGTRWHDMIELNRMAMIDATPKNTESRFISVGVRLLKRAYPNLEWILSFSDGTQCGDGTIYRASGFLLTGIKSNKTLMQVGNVIFTDISFRCAPEVRRKVLEACGITNWPSKNITGLPNVRSLPGFQLRYILPLKPGVRERLTVPVLPFSDIDKAGARMYLGKAKGSADA